MRYFAPRFTFFRCSLSLPGAFVLSYGVASPLVLWPTCDGLRNRDLLVYLEHRWLAYFMHSLLFVLTMCDV